MGLEEDRKKRTDRIFYWTFTAVHTFLWFLALYLSLRWYDAKLFIIMFIYFSAASFKPDN